MKYLRGDKVERYKVTNDHGDIVPRIQKVVWEIDAKTRHAVVHVTTHKIPYEYATDDIDQIHPLTKTTTHTVDHSLIVFED